MIGTRIAEWSEATLCIKPKMQKQSEGRKWFARLIWVSAISFLIIVYARIESYGKMSDFHPTHFLTLFYFPAFIAFGISALPYTILFLKHSTTRNPFAIAFHFILVIASMIYFIGVVLPYILSCVGVEVPWW